MRKQPYKLGLGGELKYFSQIVLPKCLVAKAIRLHHAGGLEAHLGPTKVYHKVIKSFCWGNKRQMMDDIERFIASCDICQKKGQLNERTIPPIRPRPVGYFMQQVQVDLIGPLPKAKRAGDNNTYNYCLMIGERLSRFFLAVPLTDKKAVTVARALFDNYLSVFGVPTEIFSDNGTEFAVQKELATLMGFSSSTCNSYHPKANGLVERYNKTFKNFMKVFLTPREGTYDFVHDPYTGKTGPADWLHWVKPAQMAYNNSYHSRLKAAPAEIVFGQLPRSPTTLCTGIDEVEKYRPEFEGYRFEYTRDLRAAMERVRLQARLNLENTATKVALQSDFDTTRLRTYEQGDAVLLWRPTRRLLLPWTGPFTVIRRISTLSYYIQLSARSRIKRVAVEDLKPYTGPGAPTWLADIVRKQRPNGPDAALVPHEMWIPQADADFIPKGQPWIGMSTAGTATPPHRLAILPGSPAPPATDTGVSPSTTPSPTATTR